MPEGIHAPTGDGAGGEKIGPVVEYLEKKALGNTVAEEGSDAGLGDYTRLTNDPAAWANQSLCLKS